MTPWWIQSSVPWLQAEEEKKAEQTEFTVKLTKIDDKDKVKIIREVKNLVANLNLVQVCTRLPGHACPLSSHASFATVRAVVSD